MKKKISGRTKSSSLGLAEERSSELEESSMQIMQFEEHRRDKEWAIEQALGTYGAIANK